MEKDYLLCNCDKFCFLWDRLKVAYMYERNLPLLSKLEEDNDLYHVVLTIPNVQGEDLKKSLDKMQDSFSRLIEYFSGHKEITGFDSERYGYAGAVRALEIKVIKNQEEEQTFFRPHFHCMFVLKKGLNLPKLIKNSFSGTKKEHGEEVITQFSALEVLLQKIWCLLMLDIEVTEENVTNIDSLTSGRYKDGFLVRIDKSNGKYHEIFKETITRSWRDPFTYKDFCCLSLAMENISAYKSYGCLSGFEVFEEK